MNSVVQAPDPLLSNFCQTFIAQDSILLLAKYQMMPQLICEGVIDRAISNIECTVEEINAACQQFYQQWNLTTDEQQQIWRSHCGLNQVQFEKMTTRSLRVEKFKQCTWGHKLKSHFLQRKQDLA